MSDDLIARLQGPTGAAADSMGDTVSLQQRVVAWHEARFPEAEAVHVALKMAEECGEVASALNALVGKNSATGKGLVPEEAADVVITALVLLGRWFPGADLFAEVERKLAVLTDPESTHPAAAWRALRGDDD